MLVLTRMLNSFMLKLLGLFPEFRILRLTNHRKSASKNGSTVAQS